jgi:hypothetical protein
MKNRLGLQAGIEIRLEVKKIPLFSVLWVLYN